MQNRPILFLAFLLIGAVLFFVNGCGENHHDEESHEGHGHENHHEGHDHHDDEGAGEDLCLSLHDIENVMCEHAIPAYQCAECRYEVGVVKVDDTIMRHDGHGQEGLVGTGHAQVEDINGTLTVTGEIQVNKNTAAHISPKIEGTIQAVNVDFGSKVSAGDILFTIESPDFARELSEYRKHRATVDLYATSYAREKSLYDEKITSHQEVLQAQADLKKAEADLNAAGERLQMLGFSRKELAAIVSGNQNSRQGILPVRSPIHGTVIEKHAVVGEMVRPDDDTMLVVNLDTVWVWADIYEHDLSELLDKMGEGSLPVTLRQNAFPGRSFQGRIDYVGATMNEMTRTVKVRIIVDNTNGLLRPGMFCEVQIESDGAKKVLTVPRSSVLSDNGTTFVYKHFKDDYYFRRPVQQGREFSDRIEIVSGIEDGELVITDAAFLLKSDTLRSKMGAGCAD